jgi:quercetin dioxygenase-like cupin family protein
MKNEFNESTWPCHVPDRMMDEPFLVFDFAEITKKIKSEAPWTKGDRNALTLLKKSSMSVVLIALKSPAEINFHHSGKSVSIQILEGSVNFIMNENTALLQKGSLLTLHEQIEHSLVALEESVILLTMTVHPVAKAVY